MRDFQKFKKTIWEYYKKYGRDFPWRRTRNPYRILVSESMLQQTQVSRVMQKYPEFLHAFPTFPSLARAKTANVLRAWQGLGYNRRALNLKYTAEIIVKKYNGKLPKNFEELDALPGVGKGTAGALMAFAFNIGMPFIETNIRRVFIRFFFPKNRLVKDTEIMKLVSTTLDKNCSREWYYALMDYGAMLGKTMSNPNRKSAHYTKQTSFHGSDRELRGKIMKLMLHKKEISVTTLLKILKESSERTQKIIAGLVRDGFLRTWNGKISIV